MRFPLAVGVITLASVSVLAWTPRPSGDDALRKTIDAYNAASRETMLTGHSGAAMQYYEEDVLEMSPNAPSLKGKKAILEFQQSMFQKGMRFNAVEFTTQEVESDGSVGYEIGAYTMTITMPPMGEMKDHGKYISLWRKQADGSWKLHAEMWSSDMPMPDMSAKPDGGTMREMNHMDKK